MDEKGKRQGRRSIKHSAAIHIENNMTHSCSGAPLMFFCPCL